MMKKITELSEWQALEAHQKQIANERMQDWFASDPLRYSRFSLEVGGILFDYSKNRLSAETIRLLCELAKATNLSAQIEALFEGHSVNNTEKRPALHTALRNKLGTPLHVDGQNITPLIEASLTKMQQFTDEVRSGNWRGCTNKPITDIVNIGIGGSHLGPLLTTHALADYASKDLRCHFISNIDAAHLNEVLQQINPETSLFIVSSKSFTTLETITNADTIKTWLQQKLAGLSSRTAITEKHFVAVTAASEKAIAFGIPTAQIFPLWNWIGGRYSVWSAIGLPLALICGMDNFSAFLEGAHEMDQHFRYADFSENMPVLMALLGIWYINFFATNNHAIVPYSHPLTHLRTYLQQADMESNGKSISQQGKTIEYATGPIIWGEQGCNAQHAFHQLLHQGRHLTSVDFILTGGNDADFQSHHDILIASGLSQAQALMQGKSFQQAFDELIQEGYNTDDANELAHHKAISGNRPSNILFINQVSPRNLGALLALYEHKIFVQGAIWQINSFDQWGVELGKQLLPQILTDLTNDESLLLHDSSTQGLIHHYKNLRGDA
jgi:glucose-6-phosphate isomerase